MFKSTGEAVDSLLGYVKFKTDYFEILDRNIRKELASRTFSTQERRKFENELRFIKLDRLQLAQGLRSSTLLEYAGLRGKSQHQAAAIKKPTRERRIERETYGPQPTEYRTGPGGAGLIYGWAIVYDSLSEDLGGFVEKIEFGALTDALKTSDIRCLFNHNADLVLGRAKSKTLKLLDMAAGLYFECQINNDDFSRSIRDKIRRGDISGCSFSFIVGRDEWFLRPGETDLRVIKTIKEIMDIGPVTFPAYLETSVFGKSDRASFFFNEKAVNARREQELAALEQRLGIKKPGKAR